MILLIDNYDSFTYNLYQALAQLGAELEVVRNDVITVDEIEARLDEIDGIVVSPGPCTPTEAGISVELIQRMAGKTPILGVCLGHQAMGEAFGADVILAPELKHGKTSEIFHDGKGIYSGVPNPFTATRYHSLMIDPKTVPADFVVTARSDDGIVQGMRHRTLPLEGVQYHPESFLTVVGPELLANFLRQCGLAVESKTPELIGY
ncbi:MAG: aminodeoxychorismate/anthranilate synthase component II [Thermomicrobiales bacterium]|nr:aminodeoxychorismate/anthranilate synthase component II [Thermomicrobiales bacterium]MCO5223942.1 aminodeoxychorismate/anthranilate synthase component II [Thermomicrobiales bacterium]MCO5227505.1 aminodeoxychorismate/anthranilate synthase component II [Thermomicrobiales bacterium]